MKSVKTPMKFVYAFGVLLVVTSFAQGEDVSSQQQLRPGCGDYSFLEGSAERAVFERHCGVNDDRDYQALRSALARLDAATLAHASAQRKDFRLLAVMPGMPSTPDMKFVPQVSGVKCEVLTDDDVVIWARHTDGLHSGIHRAVQDETVAFSTSYNRALVMERSFPMRRNCRVFNR